MPKNRLTNRQRDAANFKRMILYYDCARENREPSLKELTKLSTIFSNNMPNLISQQDIKKNKENVEVHRITDLSFVMNVLANSFLSKNYIPTQMINGFIVKTNGVKLRTFFEKGLNCISCGLEGQYFSIQKKAQASGSIHFLQLFATLNDQEILFTHDHTIPKSKGGGNDSYNTTTMCWPCNQEKGDTIPLPKEASYFAGDQRLKLTPQKYSYPACKMYQFSQHHYTKNFYKMPTNNDSWATNSWSAFNEFYWR